MQKRKMFTFQGDNIWENFIVVLIGSLIYIFGVKMFVANANLLTGGVIGIGQLISDLLFKYTSLSAENLKVFGQQIDLPSILFFLINAPIFYIGFKHLGKRFTLLSFLSVITVTVAGSFMNFKGIEGIDVLTNCVFGGVLIGIGIGMCLKVGASTGGTDIVAQFLALKYNMTFGAISFIINGTIVCAAGYFFGWEKALYTIINIFIVTTVINFIHTRHQKLLVTIITNNPDELISEIHSRMIRGITIVPVIGAYSRENKTMLYTVVTGYELYNIKQFIGQHDPTAFLNVTKSQGVFGAFFQPKGK